MKRKPRNPWLLVITMSGISLLAWIVNTHPPGDTFLLIASLFVIFLTLFSTTHFILKNVRRALLFSFFVVCVLILRLFQLREPIYPALLLLVILSLEVLFRNR